MKKKASKYSAKLPNAQGLYEFSNEEHLVWKELYERQRSLLKGRACKEFIEGVDRLKLEPSKIPELNELSSKLKSMTGWVLSPVEALISFDKFFSLLSQRKFPAATFIRTKEDIDYLMEPDIFHEIFGHGTMLTNPDFADFTEKIGQIGIALEGSYHRTLLARIYWFTVEFGLIRTAQGLRIYGGGILSSKTETVYSLESSAPKRHEFDLMKILYTDYDYSKLQKDYFIIESFSQVYNLIQEDLAGIFKKLPHETKDQKPSFEPNPNWC